ncbi:MAG: hypothetical protein K2O47_05635, partial [Muribaculaceae bacterium]|nr:hypothetical protein [Muribaculaceae bacterium]
MNAKDFISNASILKISVALTASVLVLLLMMKSAHQNFSYELNQPWRYPLLTAEFDTPVMRDSVSAQLMRDSIDKAFIPFVIRDRMIAARSVDRFTKIAGNYVSATEAVFLGKKLSEAYSKGVVSAELYDKIHSFPQPRLRESDESADMNAVKVIDASSMMSPSMAYRMVDSAFIALKSSARQPAKLSPDVAKALNASLVPNIVIDSVSDSKFRDQEYLNVNSALGVIKKGQRIVDRGDIINAQIYTNLNNYIDMLEKTQSETMSKKFFTTAQALYIVILFTLLYLFLAFYRKEIFRDFKKVTFIVALITLFVVIAIEAAEMI